MSTNRVSTNRVSSRPAWGHWSAVACGRSSTATFVRPTRHSDPVPPGRPPGTVVARGVCSVGVRALRGAQRGGLGGGDDGVRREAVVAAGGLVGVRVRVRMRVRVKGEW